MYFSTNKFVGGLCMGGRKTPPRKFMEFITQKDAFLGPCNPFFYVNSDELVGGRFVKERKNKEKKGGKALKNASFWVINFKTFRGGSSDPPPAPLLHNPPTNFLVEIYIKNGEKALKMLF